MYAYCFSRLRSREEAEDAVQSTFLNAFRALQREVAPSHEAAWLYKIAENVCLTRARSSVRRRRVETPGDLEAISEVVPAREPDTEELVNLPQALESMPEQQRHALLLREWQGLSYREIAEEMELSQSAVETLLFRARRTLAAGLVTDELPRRGKLARLRAGGDAGAVLALLKTLLFSGGAKVVIAGAVAASGVVGVSPGARHTIDDLFVPHMKSAAPVVLHVTAKPKTPVVQHTTPVVVAPVVVQPARPVHVVPKPAKKKAHKHVVVTHQAKPKHVGRPAHPAHPAHPVTPAAEAPTVTAVVATLEPTHDQQPPGNGKGTTPAPPAPVVPPVLPQPLPDQQQNGNGNGNDGHDHGREHEKN